MITVLFMNLTHSVPLALQYLSDGYGTFHVSEPQCSTDSYSLPPMITVLFMFLTHSIPRPESTVPRRLLRRRSYRTPPLLRLLLVLGPALLDDVELAERTSEELRNVFLFSKLVFLKVFHDKFRQEPRLSRTDREQ